MCRKFASHAAKLNDQAKVILSDCYENSPKSGAKLVVQTAIFTAKTPLALLTQLEANSPLWLHYAAAGREPA
jgi:hypothetical protein